ncbi:MAG: SAP domain-containing protein, partial [Selenomonadaceae bacterium]|nr:SAP domain-containing protein [Selenomonadaceae bacterium]
MALSLRDVYLLDLFTGRTGDYTIWESHYDIYGTDYKERVQWLLNNGYFTFENDMESLMRLTNKELQDILRANFKKVSGIKKDLVQRIIDNIPKDSYASNLVYRYKPTDKGEGEITDKAIYLENKKNYYGFLDTEIAHAESVFEKRGIFNKDEVLLFLFNKKINEQKQKCNYNH